MKAVLSEGDSELDRLEQSDSVGLGSRLVTKGLVKLEWNTVETVKSLILFENASRIPRPSLWTGSW